MLSIVGRSVDGMARDIIPTDPEFADDEDPPIKDTPDDVVLVAMGVPLLLYSPITLTPYAMTLGGLTPRFQMSTRFPTLARAEADPDTGTSHWTSPGRKPSGCEAVKSDWVRIVPEAKALSATSPEMFAPGEIALDGGDSTLTQ